jgi:hypothetical protein
MFVLILIGCSGRTNKSSKSSKSEEFPSGGKTEILGGVRYTLALNEYNVHIGEPVQIFFTVKNISGTTVILTLAGAPEFHFDVFRGDELIFNEPQEIASSIGRMELIPNVEKRYQGVWMQTNIINMKPGKQVPAGSYKIRAYISGHKLPMLDTLVVITEKK